MQRVWMLIAAVIAAWGLAPLPVCADPPQAPPAPVAAPPPAAAVQEAKPELLYIKGKNDELVPLLGFTMEYLDRLITQDNVRQQGPIKPLYKLDKLVATGSAKNNLAELTIRFTILIDDDGWVRVPLRLSDAVLRDKVSYTGPGEYRLDYDEPAEQYLVWLKGKGDKPHTLELSVVAPLATVAGETRLKLNLPRAWASELTFTVPLAKAVAQVSSGATLDASRQINNSTEFHVLGVGSDFNMAWRAGTVRPTSAAAVLEATGAIQAKIDGRSVHTQARLTVRSFGGEFDNFRVRLPKGSVLVSQETADYTLAPITTSKGKNEPPQIEVRLKERTTGPINVLFEVEQMAGAGDKPTPIDLAGFEILGAVRQWGHIAVSIEGDWQLLWDTRRSVRQVDALPPEIDEDGVIAGFEYFAQPFVLGARIVAKESRVHVEPAHLLLVHGKSAELQTRLKFRVGGARVHAVQLDLADWQVDAVEPDVLVNRDQLVTRERAPLTIPLRQGTAGEFEIVVRALRQIDDLTAPLTWPIPQVRASTATPAQVIVVPDDDVDLEVQAAETKDLVRQYVKPLIEPPRRQQAPLVFQVAGAQPQLTARVQMQQRTIAVGVENALLLKANQFTYRTALNYQIARQAVDHLLLQAPAQLVEQGQLDVLHEGVPLTVSVIADPDGDPHSPRRLRVALPSSQIGVVRLEARATIALPKPLTDAHQAVRLPLVMPAEGDFRGATTTVEVGDGVSCHASDGFWTSDEPAGGASVTLASRVPRTELGLELHTIPVAQQSVAIERCWLQSFLTTQGRIDRLALVCRGGQSLAITLPPGSIAPEGLRNGARVALAAGATAEQIVVPLERGDLPQRIELTYRQPGVRLSPVFGATALVAPQFACRISPRHTYWQLVLGPEDHLVSLAGPVTLEQTWGWRGWSWGRWPVLDQAELEAWSGATPQTPLPEQAHVYLAQAHGEIVSLSVISARGSLLVLLGGSLALLAGLAWMRWPQVRQGPVILSLALVGTAVACIYPEPASVMGLAAVPGVMLGGMAIWLRNRTQRSGPASIVTRAAISSPSERPSTRTHIPARSPSVSTGSGTATAQFNAASLIEPTPSAEAKP